MKKSAIILVLFFISGLLQAQQRPPFWNEIQEFKKQDSIHFPPLQANLFVGSSSFTMWKDVQEYFPKYIIINRGFGGSSLSDLVQYANDIIFPYKPRQIVIYCGENDLAASDTVTAQLVLEKFKILFNLIRVRFREIPIVFISLKPSPSRQQLMPKMEAANKMIKDFLKTKTKTVFVDVYHQMLDKDGKPIKDLFTPDNLHMNKKGYVIWQKAIVPYLLK